MRFYVGVSQKNIDKFLPYKDKEVKFSDDNLESGIFCLESDLFQFMKDKYLGKHQLNNFWIIAIELDENSISQILSNMCWNKVSYFSAVIKEIWKYSKEY